MLSSLISRPSPPLLLALRTCQLLAPYRKTQLHHMLSPHHSSHTSVVRRFTGFSDAQTPTWDPLRSGQTMIQLVLHCILLVLYEIPFNALCSSKEPSTFIAEPYKKRPHKIHHNIYCKDGFRELFITFNSSFLWGHTGKTSPWYQHQQ